MVPWHSTGKNSLAILFIRSRRTNTNSYLSSVPERERGRAQLNGRREKERLGKNEVKKEAGHESSGRG
jgi:hypothetical protein